MWINKISYYLLGLFHVNTLMFLIVGGLLFAVAFAKPHYPELFTPCTIPKSRANGQSIQRSYPSTRALLHGNPARRSSIQASIDGFCGGSRNALFRHQACCTRGYRKAYLTASFYRTIPLDLLMVACRPNPFPTLHRTALSMCRRPSSRYRLGSHARSQTWQSRPS